MLLICKYTCKCYLISLRIRINISVSCFSRIINRIYIMKCQYICTRLSTFLSLNISTVIGKFRLTAEKFLVTLKRSYFHYCDRTQKIPTKTNILSCVMTHQTACELSAVFISALTCLKRSIAIPIG